jgi:hypothetical protein
MMCGYIHVEGPAIYNIGFIGLWLEISRKERFEHLQTNFHLINLKSETVDTPRITLISV